MEKMRVMLGHVWSIYNVYSNDVRSIVADTGTLIVLVYMLIKKIKKQTKKIKKQTNAKPVGME